MGAADHRPERDSRSSESRERHLASVRERAREELAGRLADLGERMRLIGAAVTDPDSQPPDAYPYTTYTDANGVPYTYSNPEPIDVALTALDCASARDFDLHTYESNNGRGPHATTRLNPADDGVWHPANPGPRSDRADRGGPVPDMEVDR